MKNVLSIGEYKVNTLLYLRNAAWVSLSFIILGKLGCLLAIPPGYATAIFPSSGIALYALLVFGVRLWPAVFIGSGLLSLWIGMENGAADAMQVVVISALAIALASTLQALAAYTLIKKKLGLPLTLVKTRDIVLFTAVLAPASSLISSSLGVTILMISSQISSEQWLFSWFTWWVGNTVGLLLLVPIALSCHGFPRSIWHPRRVFIALPLSLLTILIVVVFSFMSRLEQEKISTNFLKKSELHQKALKYSLDQYLDALYALQNYISGDSQLSHSKFSQFANGLLKRNSGIHALSWNPVVSKAQRQLFELHAAHELGDDFQIVERDQNNQLITATARARHVVVKYIQPLKGNESAVGFDVNSNKTRQAALRQAEILAKAVGTARITLVQETQKQSGLLVFLPVFYQTQVKSLRGYVVGVFRIGALLNTIFDIQAFDSLYATLADKTDKHSPPVNLASFGSGSQQSLTADSVTFAISFAERDWQLNVTPSVYAIEEQRSLNSWFILTSIFAIAALGSALLLFLTGRTFEVSSLVRLKTAELKDSEAKTRAILTTAVDAIITIDNKGIIESANPAAYKLFGYTANELQGKNIKILMPEHIRVNHDQFLEKYYQSGERKVIGSTRELLAQDKQGSPIHISLSVSEVRLAGRTIFTGVVHDLSEQKKIQLALEITLEQLQESRDNLLLTLNQFRVATLIVNKQGVIEFASESCHTLPGWREKSPIGKSWLSVLPFSPEARHQLEKALAGDISEQRISVNWATDHQNQYWVDIDIKKDPNDLKRHILYMYDVSEIHVLREQINVTHYGKMLGQSQPMQKLYQELEQLAAGDWNVLIEGETGTGKELAARAIHASSQRKQGPFIAVNTAGLTETLLASQLFGHKKGSFTGAIQDQKGLFESAANGTLFLDEIGDISPSIQKSLLRVLQEKEIMRLGDNKTIAVNARVIAATNKNLQIEVNEKRFREDLFYRLRVGRVEMPPLRVRNGDIALLIEYFLSESRILAGKPAIKVDKQVMDTLRQYPWPGNIRELKNLVEYVVIHCQEDYIRLSHLPPELFTHNQQTNNHAPEEDERCRIIDALKTTGGKRSRAAELLGISRATFYRKIKEHDIQL
ncbi:sigma 54-interacting transcriptional regulator [Thalassomonas sp. RHCl1]|uniref:sigma 54-interacting transcriptional regulator n=1 Tax=Thalassomonas sp. RHCl1 TaxID=2995320 RepID=UPI00248AE686|nr:sigma 54-interacting transcriptional regulator [Thalassomonas sp. RHCl1]